MSDETSAAPVAIVTGAGSGIGRALCHRLADRGWRLVLAGRRREPLEAAAEALEAETLVHPADMADPADAAALVDAAVEAFGRIDGLVNNAGLAVLAPIAEHTPELIRRTLDVNTLGPAAAIARAWPVLARQGRGRIVNVSSRAAVDPFPGFFAYAAAKSALNMLALAAAREGADVGIRAFAVAPGAVETPMLRGLFDESQIPSDAAMSPDLVAGVIEACLAGSWDAHAGATIHVSPEHPAGTLDVPA